MQELSSILLNVTLPSADGNKSITQNVRKTAKTLNMSNITRGRSRTPANL